jgi:hypothetical protein
MKPRTTYQLPVEVEKFLAEHGADVDEFQNVIAAKQPFVPTLDPDRTMLVAMLFVWAQYDARDAIQRAARQD